MNDEWTKGFLSRWEKDYKETSTTSNSSAKNLKEELKQLEEKQMRLLDAYLDQTITNEEYTATKNKLMNRKVEIKELTDFGRKDIRWLELPYCRPKNGLYTCKSVVCRGAAGRMF